MSLKDHVLAEPPALLFKYAGHWSESFFKDPCLRFSPPTKFNDPFDFYPSLHLKINRRTRHELCLRWGFPTTLSTKELAIKLAELTRSGIGEDYAALCMSELPDNVLMWGHYADKHEGCVLGLDGDIIRGFQLLSGTPHYAGQVAYTEQKQIIPYPQEDILEENRKIIFSKALDWKYEHEWRLVIKRKFKAGESHVDINFDPSCLWWVIIGCRAAEAGKADIYKTALKANEKLRHVRLYYAEKDPKDYRLRIHSEAGDLINWRDELLKIKEEKIKNPKDPWYKEAADARRAKFGI